MEVFTLEHLPEETEIETKMQYSLPGEDKDGDSVADEPENADPVEQHPGNPELEDGVVHLIRRRVLQYSTLLMESC